MTVPYQFDALDDRTDFESHLQQLVAAARDRHIPIKGAYDVRSPAPGEQDYQVAISEVVSKSGSAPFSSE